MNTIYGNIADEADEDSSCIRYVTQGAETLCNISPLANSQNTAAQPLNGNLTIDTQTGYVLALYYGVYRRKEKLLRGFRRRLERDFYRITCGFTGAPLMLPVLLDNGMTDIGYRMLLTEEFPGWLYAVNLEATTIWERWNSLDADGTISGTGMNSLNHYAYGSVCEAIYSRIMGLQNAAPGWKKALIAPKIDGRLKHAAIVYDSPSGTWKAPW